MKTFRMIALSSLALVLSACSIFQTNNPETSLTASGNVAATTINIAPEISGKVTEVAASEGDTVQAGDVLFNLDCTMLQAQGDQAQAALDVANASVVAAGAQRDNAQAQYDLTLQSVQQASTPQRSGSWSAPVDDAFDLPNWYFQPDETVAAAEAELDAAQKNLEAETGNLSNELKKASNADFVSAEKRLAQAQIAYQVAYLTNQQSQDATQNSDLVKAAEDALDAATNELNAAQSAYDGMLTSSGAQSVLEARARVAAAQARQDNAQDSLSRLQTGDHSLQLQVASTGVKQAEAAVTQAQDNAAQASAALNLINLQIGKCAVKAPQAGIVSARNIESGEMAAAGGTVMVLSQLDPVTVTVYIPEDRYGQVKLGQQVSLVVDSFPGQTFQGEVQTIADQAEFTPRDVQTVSGRKATVYAVKVVVPNEKGLLKPGMPADVTFLP